MNCREGGRAGGREGGIEGEGQRADHRQGDDNPSLGKDPEKGLDCREGGREGGSEKEDGFKGGRLVEEAPGPGRPVAKVVRHRAHVRPEP